MDKKHTLTEIVEQLEFCQFTDAEGHPLENNIAFVDLKKMASEEYSTQEKPVLGVMPRNIWLEKRLEDLKLAVGRYTIACKPIPTEWVAEHKRITEELNERG